jgi:hypothetical protein
MRSACPTTLSLSLILGLGACATTPWSEVNATVNPTSDFRSFRTYAFVPADRLDMSGSQMADPVTRRNLEAAIGRELQAKGLSLAASDTMPSLLVSYFADVYQGPDRKRPISGGAGGTNEQRQGELIIELIDTVSQQVAWRGDAWVRDPNAQIAERIVVDLFRKYPQAR